MPKLNFHFPLTNKEEKSPCSLNISSLIMYLPNLFWCVEVMCLPPFNAFVTVCLADLLLCAQFKCSGFLPAPVRVHSVSHNCIW